jgi:restriction system protein
VWLERHVVTEYKLALGRVRKSPRIFDDSATIERALMAKKNESQAMEFVNAVALAPWSVGLSAAVASYFGLHHFAKQRLVLKPGQVKGVVTQTLWHSLATVGQWLLPTLFVIAATQSFIVRRRRHRLVESVGGDNPAEVVNALSWRDFEVLVGEAYRLRGYSVRENGGGGADGGVDLVLTKGSETTLVQCKQWRAQTVGVKIVRELFGVMSAQGAASCEVVTSGRFTTDAKEFALGRKVELVDGAALLQMISAAKLARSVGSSTSIDAVPRSEFVRPGAQAQLPACPLCSREMIKRTAKQGANVGQEFWGCPGYPRCRGTRPALV